MRETSTIGESLTKVIGMTASACNLQSARAGPTAAASIAAARAHAIARRFIGHPPLPKLDLREAAAGVNRG